jgi:hypothetical protein
MYYQIFIRNKDFKRRQFSCDDWNEVLELITTKMPIIFEVHYYNESGLKGIAYKKYDYKANFYRTYKLIADNKTYCPYRYRNYWNSSNEY